MWGLSELSREIHVGIVEESLRQTNTAVFHYTKTVVCVVDEGEVGRWARGEKDKDEEGDEEKEICVGK